MDFDITSLVTRITQLNRLPKRQVTSIDGTPIEVDNSTLTAMIVGSCFGMRYELPTSPVAQVNTHFSQRHGAHLRAVLSRINELAVLRTEVAYDAAVAMYSDRYKLVHAQNDNLSCLLDRLMYCQAPEALEQARVSRQVLQSLSQVPEELSLFESLFKASRHLTNALTETDYLLGGA